MSDELLAALREAMRIDPEVAQRLAARHTPDRDGRCTGCSYAGRVTGRDCTLAWVAQQALADTGRRQEGEPS